MTILRQTDPQEIWDIVDEAILDHGMSIKPLYEELKRQMLIHSNEHVLVRGKANSMRVKFHDTGRGFGLVVHLRGRVHDNDPRIDVLHSPRGPVVAQWRNVEDMRWWFAKWFKAKKAA